MTAIPDIDRPLWLRPLGLALLTLVLCSAAFPAWADDEAQANRLMVEAVGLIAAAEDAPSAGERLRLLRTAHERLTEIVRRLPSTDLAMRLATGQQIGNVSLAELREALEDAQTVAEATPPVRTAPAKPGAPVQAWRHDAAVVAVGWTSGDQRLSVARREWVTTVSSDGVGAVRDINTGATLHTWQHRDRPTAVALSPSGHRVLMVARNSAGAVYDTATGAVLAEWGEDFLSKRRAGRPSAAALFPGEPLALIGLGEQIGLIDVAFLDVSRAWAYGAPVTAIAISRDGRRLLAGLASGEAVFGAARSGAALRVWEHPGSGGGGVMAAVFSRDGRRVLTGAANRTAVLRDADTGAGLHEWEIRREVLSVAYASSGRWVLTGDDGYGVELHNVGTGNTLRRWRYDASPRSLAFSPDDRRVLMGFDDGAAIVCDLRLPQGERRTQRTELTPEEGCW